ncbi:MAG: penicillin-binding protein activator [Chitinispirillales bacterium]|jgi:ABC-type branched-subunit amino acid transport system substrate-binding protein|nr:penicillin-binding protein activator [Chitinispirillales bacterium]
MKKLFLSVAAFCLLAVTGVSAAQADVSPLFTRAKNFYAEGRYDSTIVIIREHLRRHGRDPENFILVPLVTEAYMRKNERSLALRLIGMYRQQYPESPFMPRMTYLEGVIHAKEAKPLQALASFSMALTLGVSADLLNLIIANAESICGRSLSVDELSTLSSRADLHPALLETVRFYEIQKFAETGQAVRARNSAEIFRSAYPHSRYSDRINQFLTSHERERRSGNAPVQVGLLVPMSGDDADFGRYVLQGTRLAIDDHNARARSPVKFIVYDTKGSPVETARRSQDLLMKDQAQVCIGPILSSTAAVSAAMFGGRDIIMITPTASEDGISVLGDNIFQMNVTPGTMARKLAGYALDNLSVREFAIIAPDNALSHVMAEAFKGELSKRNIEVVHEVYYAEGTHDFTSTLRGLRAALIGRRLEAVAADRGERRTAPPTANEIARFNDTTLAIGGLFMPLLKSEDVTKLASQVVFQRIRTQMLGTGGWNDPRVLIEGGRYVNDAIIATGIQPDMQSSAWREFAVAYKARYNSDPNRVSALGYDAARLVIKAIEDTGGADITKLKSALKSVREYNGLSGIISFDPQTGSNVGAAIMKITDGRFIRVM